MVYGKVIIYGHFLIKVKLPTLGIRFYLIMLKKKKYNVSALPLVKKLLIF